MDKSKLEWDEQSTQLHVAFACLCPPQPPAPKAAASKSAPAAAAAAGSPISSSATPATPVESTDEPEDPATSRRLLAMLQDKGVPHTTLEHAPTRTSEESAAVRGVSLASGAKALFMKSKTALEHGSPYVLAVMSAARKADLNALKKAIGTKNMGMASPEEVWSITGCRPGAVPPFGSLFPGVKTVLDRSLVQQGDRINFNAGLRTLSVGMAVQDYLSIEQPLVLEFTA